MDMVKKDARNHAPESRGLEAAHLVRCDPVGDKPQMRNPAAFGGARGTGVELQTSRSLGNTIWLRLPRWWNGRGRRSTSRSKARLPQHHKFNLTTVAGE